MIPHLSKLNVDAQIRTFLAVELPKAEKERLARLGTAFAQYTASLRWTAPDLLHITVRFLGGVPQSKIGSVRQAAAEATLAISPFSLHISGLGAFPDERVPRVIWVGLSRDAGYESLQRLFSRLEAALAEQGFEREGRAFSPHITLARTRDQISSEDRRALGRRIVEVQRTTPVAGSFRVEALTVMRSDLGRSGPRYTPITSQPLGALPPAERGGAVDTIGDAKGKERE
jgi:2'-5' RNA ligase